VSKIIRLLMQKLIFLFLLSLTFPAHGQNFILPTGEYMDTLTVASPGCTLTWNYNYYYSSYAKYPRNSATLLAEIQTHLKTTAHRYTGSGYVTFHFFVDCQGKVINRIRVTQTDSQYAEHHFEKQLVEDLYRYFKTLKEWKIAKYDSGEPLNYAAYLTFRIQNGKVVAVAP
jgi:hypothetical protein